MELVPTPKPPTDKFGQVRNHSADDSRAGETPQSSAAIHQRSDVDATQVALHHTLGIGRNQASPGNHLHDGTTSEKLGGHVFDTTPGNEGKTIPALTLTGSRSSGAAVASLIAMLSKFVDFVDNTSA